MLYRQLKIYGNIKSVLGVGISDVLIDSADAETFRHTDFSITIDAPTSSPWVSNIPEIGSIVLTIASNLYSMINSCATTGGGGDYTSRVALEHWSVGFNCNWVWLNTNSRFHCSNITIYRYVGVERCSVDNSEGCVISAFASHTTSWSIRVARFKLLTVCFEIIPCIVIPASITPSISKRWRARN